MNNTEKMMSMMLELAKFGFTKEEILAVVNANSSAPTSVPQIAKAEAIDAPVIPVDVPVTAVKPATRKLSAEELMAFAEDSSVKDYQLGAWRSVSKVSGKEYTWFGWALVKADGSIKPEIPMDNGCMLYHINDFYLKRDYGAYHPGKTCNYKFKDGGRAFISSYKVRHEVDKKDAKAFMAYMTAKEEAKAQRTHDTVDYSSWINHSK